MIERELEFFDLGQICGSGQCFRMYRQEGDAYRVLASDKSLKVTKEAGKWQFWCSQEEFDGFWEPYFDLGTDYGRYIERINPRDKYLLAAADFGSGIRILRQDLWEMIVSFLISQQNNIVRIRRCIQNLCERFGEEKTDGEGAVYYSFPRPEALAGLEEDALKECNLGYRSKYVVRAARSVAAGEIDLERIRRLPCARAKEELLGLYGVGGEGGGLHLPVCPPQAGGVSGGYAYPPGAGAAL